MGLPRQLKKQVQEANEILAELARKPGDPEAPPADPNAQPPADPNAPAPSATPAPSAIDNKKPDQPAVPAGGSDPQPSVSQPPPAEDFERKYRVLQGKYDAEIASANRQIAQLNERLLTQQNLIETMRANPAPPTPAADNTHKAGKKFIKEEDVEEYGKDMVEFAKRAALEAIQPELDTLRSENAELKRQLGQTQEVTAQSARERVYLALDRDVPDWQTINTNQKFLDWLGEPDVFSGTPRGELLGHAYKNNDVTRVVNIFKAFKREDSAIAPTPTPTGRTPALDVATLVAPGSPKSASAEAPGDTKRTWSQAEISSFYEQKRRGKISAADALNIEREIALATREGRVKL
jgi:hypothetical protein